MISDCQKIEIAKSFVEQYPTPFAAWTPDGDHQSEDERYLAAYEHLISGVYGDCYGINAEYDEENNLIQDATKFEVTVEQFESKDGDEKVFFFEKTDQPSGLRKFIKDHGQQGDG